MRNFIRADKNWLDGLVLWAEDDYGRMIPHNCYNKSTGAIKAKLTRIKNRLIKLNRDYQTNWNLHQYIQITEGINTGRILWQGQLADWNSKVNLS